MGALKGLAVVVGILLAFAVVVGGCFLIAAAVTIGGALMALIAVGTLIVLATTELYNKVIRRKRR